MLVVLKVWVLAAAKVALATPKRRAATAVACMPPVSPKLTVTAWVAA